MPRGILNRNIYVDGVWTTTEELRDSLLNRNLPPPITDSVIEAGLESFQEEMGNVVFGLPNLEENISLDKESIKSNETKERNTLLNYNKYYLGDDRDEYYVIAPNINTEEKNNGDYTTQNFGLVGFNNSIVIRNPFDSIDAPRDNNFDSNLGNIGSNRLEFLLNERVSQAIINETTGRINTNVLNIANGGEFIQSNYDITTQANIIGKGVELLGRLSGTYLPVSTIPKGAIGWQEYNTAKANSGKLKEGFNKLMIKLGVSSELNLTTEGRTLELLKRTGAGQKNALFRHLSLNQYSPSYKNPRLLGLLGDRLLGERGTEGRYYIGDENTTNKKGGVNNRFTSKDFIDTEDTNTSIDIDENFIWGDEDKDTFPSQTILSETNNLTELHSETGVFIDQTKKFFKDKTSDKEISRGNAIKNNSGEYARVWLKASDGTERSRIEKGYSYQNAIRKSGLFTKDESKAGFSVDAKKASLSVLQSNGMVKHFPYLEESFTTYKKYMLSLENLAWSDNLADLPMQEIGPGDLLSGRKGRIMWFAPYGLSFDEQSNTQWSEHKFIGRSEPLYTYNTTSRSGQLKFKVVVDHPRIINEYRGRQDNEIEKFLAGITSPKEFLDFIEDNTRLNVTTKKELEKKLNSIVRGSVQKTTETKELVIYFQNNVSDAPPTTYQTDKNKDYIDLVTNGVTSEIGKFLSNKEGKYEIKLKGYASKSAPDNYNQTLSLLRNISIEKLLKEYTPKNQKFISKGLGETKAVAGENVNKDDEQAVIDRRVEVEITYSVTPDPMIQKSELDKILGDELDMVNNLFINETTYFDVIKDDYPNYFDNISSKIKYFHPGFHSTTPEGLNTRLTFLQQCMRQGNSVYSDTDKRRPDNLSFGRPPVCILRIGDFIHTKIIIDTLNIVYTNGGDIQWDLNPEGIGVQPMTAEVSLSIKIIGGQSLQGPINRLQNAMSYNFYANTEMYDSRSDSIELNEGKGKIVSGIKLGEDRSRNFAESLKTEIPINQELTNEKQETITEPDYEKLLGKIEINSNKEFGDPETIILSKIKDVEIDPSELIDGSGENKIKVVITNLNNNEEVFNGFQREKSWAIPISKIDKVRHDNSSKMSDVYSEIIGKEVEIEDEEDNDDRERVIETLKRELKTLQKKLETLIKDNTIKFKVRATFTRGEDVSPKTKSYIYKWDDDQWIL